MFEFVISFHIFFLLLVTIMAFAYCFSCYKVCPPNKAIVVYGNGVGTCLRCIIGEGVFVIPIIQGYEFLSLKPMVVGIDLKGALAKTNARINVSVTSVVAISTKPAILLNAAQKLLLRSELEIKLMAQYIIMGQIRLVVSEFSPEEILEERCRFAEKIEENINAELNKIGLSAINVKFDLCNQNEYIANKEEIIRLRDMYIAEKTRELAESQSKEKEELNNNSSDKNIEFNDTVNVEVEE